MHRKYEQSLREVDLSTFGRMSGCNHVAHKSLAYLLSLKRGIPCCSVMA